MNIHWRDWCWSWGSSTLATWCKELTHWKRPWCWERLKVGREGDDRGWDGRMASPTQWTWVRVNSGSWWWTGRPGVLRFMGSQRVRHDWATELNWTKSVLCIYELSLCTQVCVKVKVKMLVTQWCYVWLFAIPWTIAHQTPLSMGFFRQEYWSGQPFSSPGSSQPRAWTQSTALQAGPLLSEPPGKTIYSMLRKDPNKLVNIPTHKFFTVLRTIAK